MTASLILRKLAAYPRQNSLATGLREYGRLERTLFTLKWLRDPALRRRVTGGLNKGEARNALARTVFFHRLGEIRRVPRSWGCAMRHVSPHAGAGDRDTIVRSLFVNHH